MNEHSTDIRCVSASLYFLPVTTRVPLKFGTETLTSVTCARVKVVVEDRAGRRAEGWGETPLSVQWVWPSTLPHGLRHDRLCAFTRRLVSGWASCDVSGHPIEIGHRFTEEHMKPRLGEFNSEPGAPGEPMPHLAGLVASSAFDIAVHDAYGVLHAVDTYETYGEEYMNRDLAGYFGDDRFAGRYPCDYFVESVPTRLPVWHLVGGKDPVEADELVGDEPGDGYPVLLRDWIERDGLFCLKVKLRGDDEALDYDRLLRVGRICDEMGVLWLTTDFNCTVTKPSYVNEILDRLIQEHPRIYGQILYVEQPFPYDLETHRIDVHSVSARKPLFMDESAHDWKLIRLGRELGWTGVALKTCKTQTGALLSLCWAKEHGMTLMVQDLTNPMLAQIPHLRLAAQAGTIMGVESNAMQFYPDASHAEEKIHPGLYRRRDGYLDLQSLRGLGFGYRISEIERELPPAEVEASS